VKEITLTVTEASRGFSDLVNRVRYCGESATLTKNGKAVARLVPIGPPPITGAELAKRWKPGSHLTPKETAAFAREIEKGRKSSAYPTSGWSRSRNSS
jgi:prevent-host-death family protein